MSDTKCGLPHWAKASLPVSPVDLCVSDPPTLGLRVQISEPSFYLGAGELKSDSHGCRTHALPTESSPPPYFILRWGLMQCRVALNLLCNWGCSLISGLCTLLRPLVFFSTLLNLLSVFKAHIMWTICRSQFSPSTMLVLGIQLKQLG